MNYPLSINGRRCTTHAYRVLDRSLRPLREFESEDYRAKTAALDLAVALALRHGRPHHVVNVETRFTWHVSGDGGIVAVGPIHAEAEEPTEPGDPP